MNQFSQDAPAEKEYRAVDADQPTGEPICILLADDHALFRAGLRHLLKGLPHPVDLAEAGSRTGIVAMLESRRLDLILLELLLRDSEPATLLAEIRQRAPEVPIIVISGTEQPEIIHTALDEGAAGFVPKSSRPEVMLRAIELVLAGGIYLPPPILKLFQYSLGDRSRGTPEVPRPILTGRQRVVLELLAKGKSNKEIARNLILPIGIVKAQLSGLMKTLGARNRSQVIIKAIKLRLIK